MRRGLSQTARHVITHGERGQTIVILAFGIVVLLAFVGIVTDVSLMFVRFSTLRRAVDAAAVSAAGQVRRLVPTIEEWENPLAHGNYANAKTAAAVFNRAEPIEADWVASGADADAANGLAFARNIANVKLAAESFIEFYGLDPIAVVVDTCATRPTDAELCTDDQRKLIRVTAQISSPTVFLKLIGWPDITLESTSLSETAVLDVVLVMDVSESMLNETTYNDWERVPDEIHPGSVINLGYRYIPPRMTTGDPSGINPIVQVDKEIFGNDWQSAWWYMLNHSWADISADPRFDPIQFYPPSRPGAPDEATREQCRIRFYPGSGVLGNKDETFPADLKAEYEARLGATWPKSWDGFIPTYNFYGCCNDPVLNMDTAQNYDFTDLICQPFRQARDATEQFLQRIDFLRGDRVGIVTFDRNATLLLPLHIPGNGAITSHMIDNETDALNLLRKAVGVRAENTFYADSNDDGLWDHFVSGGRQITYTDSVDGVTPGWDLQSLGTIVDYPTKDSCPFLNATRIWPFSVWSVPSVGTALAGIPYHPDAAEQPDYYEAPLKTIMHPSDLDAAGWNAYFLAGGGLPAGPNRTLYSYELRASCRGTNMGAALRTGYNALTDSNTRRDTGSVWVMVLLSDGAAGASDPATRNSLPLDSANPYLNPAEPGFLNNPDRGDYGAYGVCPFGTPDNPGELVDYEASKPHFPYCGDEIPETRHFCFDPNLLYAAPDGSVNISIELSNARFPNCQLEYDVDDYARDWADFIGLEEPFPWATIDTDNALAQSVAGKRTGTQLPTIFSIGFGLRFPNGTGSCTENVEDCLGEELLRYIADVGDNQQIDTDYQQDVRYDSEADLDIGAGNSFGGRGPCEGPVLRGYADADDVRDSAGGQLSDIINPLHTGLSCGNYYNAPSGRELEVVFDEIASRMFTQLAQ